MQTKPVSAPADVMLTAKGERYATEHSVADPLIVGARRLPRKALKRLRREAEAEVARLIDIIDRIDGDADLEPSLSSPEAARQVRWACGGREDLEEDSYLEDGGDEEPSLCGQAVIIGRSMIDGSAQWPQQSQTVDSGVDQTYWSGGGDQDLEAEFDGREEGYDREEDEEREKKDARELPTEDRWAEFRQADGSLLVPVTVATF